MPYEVIAEDATVPKSLGRVVDRNGNEYEENVSFVYPKGTVLDDKDVSPTIIRLYEEGDEHVRSILKETDETAAKAAERFESEAEKAREEAGEQSAVGKFTTAGGDQAPYIDYDLLSAKELVERMKVLTPGQVDRVKRWERDHGRGRTSVLEFDGGEDFLAKGASPEAYAPGQVDPGEAAAKAAVAEEDDNAAGDKGEGAKGPGAKGVTRKEPDAGAKTAGSPTETAAKVDTTKRGKSGGSR